MNSLVPAAPRLLCPPPTAAGGTYLWMVNPTRSPRQAVITLSDRYGPFSKAKDLRQQKTPAATGRIIQAPLEDRNVAVIRLE